MSYVAYFLIGSGVFFFAIGTIGVLRLPDFYSRLHAAGKCDTLATILVALGIALYNLQPYSFGNLLVSLKILAVIGFVFVASPTATHALTRAALVAGVEHWTRTGKGDKR